MRPITSQEAQQSLDDIKRVAALTRRALAVGGSPYYLILWGVIWTVGFLFSQFGNAPTAGYVWMVLDSAGIIGSFWLGLRMAHQVRSSTMGPRLGWFWLALMGYGGLLIWLAAPLSGQKSSLLIVLLAMFGYVVMGLWLNSQTSIKIGLIVTVLSISGYYWLPDYYYLVMAFLGGGTMIGSGWLMMHSWGK